MRTGSVSDGHDTIFDAPVQWRADAAVALGLDGEELIAGLGQGAAYPTTLRTLVASFPPRVEDIVDIGSGSGAVSEWIRRAAAAEVTAVEPSAPSRAVAERCFPDLRVTAGSADRTGLDAASADVVTMCGVLSLVAEMGPALAEAKRVVRRGGLVAIVDLFAAGTDDLRDGRDVFRSLANMRSSLHDHGLVLTTVECRPVRADPAWTAASKRVDQWIEEHHADDPAFAAWKDDQRRLAARIHAGDLVAGCLTSTVAAPA